MKIFLLCVGIYFHKLNEVRFGAVSFSFAPERPAKFCQRVIQLLNVIEDRVRDLIAAVLKGKIIVRRIQRVFGVVAVLTVLVHI